MKILYDHQMFTLQRFGGVTRYFADLMSHLPAGVEPELALKYSENHYLEQIKPEMLKSFQTPGNFRFRRQLYYFLNQKIAHRAIGKNDFSLFHPTYYDPYFLRDLKKPFVLTVHDMIHERYPLQFTFYDHTRERKKLLMERAAHIIAVSENTKKDIVELVGIDEKKISVIHHGYAQTVKPEPPLFENYILFVGERRGYKNFKRFMQAVAPILKARRDLKVVCTGNPFEKGEKQFFEMLGIVGQVEQLKATDAMLASLYQHALVFVYPSLYEGFGIPILEAFTNHCPVCVSDRSCFPEVGQEAVLYFDPESLDSIRETISRVLNSPAVAEELRKKGEIRLQDFSIEKMVEETCRVYSQTVS